MRANFRWRHAVTHRGQEAAAFLSSYFSQDDREPLLIGGAGFDPRSTFIARLLSDVRGPERLRGFFIREERPRSSPDLRVRAEANIDALKRLLRYASDSLNIISEDGAVVGGQHVGQVLQRGCDFAGITDVLVDFSALSKGVSFPIVRALLDGALGRSNPKPNLHVVVYDHPVTD